MPRSVRGPEVRAAIDAVREPDPVRPLTPSPADWRDGWIYFAMVDRFDNPHAPPRHLPFDAPFGGFQGGTIDGVRRRLDYLQSLGVGALWITPVLRNVARVDGAPNEGTYHGYGIQNFLAVDPRYASDPRHADAELRRLVDDAHARGIYVILDIVLNHTGDVFAYDGGSTAAHADAPRRIHWRDAHGVARPEWTTADAIGSLPPLDAAVFPDELRHDAMFRRQGAPAADGPETIGDFGSLKQLVTSDPAVADALIRAHQYVIARWDVDGFRVDTLKYLDREFARTFGNAMREFALGAGKKNFFTFGEVYDDEAQIARFVGRNTRDANAEIVGVDAALDFPLFFKLPAVLKGMLPPSEIAGVYQRRKAVEREVVSSHGEATRFFVTFLDNHDQHERFRFEAADDPHRYDDQVTLALACQFALPGIPCVYYGTEQGLAGRGASDQNVREALWGKPGAFDPAHPLARALRALSDLRRRTPALRYGRFYFRPVSGDGVHFGVSPFRAGVLAFSRILGDREVLVVANTSASDGFVGEVIVDASLNAPGSTFAVLHANRADPAAPGAVRVTGAIEVREVDGSSGTGPAAVVRVALRPMEVQVLG
ncbi:alpha-amylase family glycosyl hydrolase [Gemmatirosa kalamazoonensis]|uniref:alpha-amylase family glycosyl hydrolase n=1 Tax=Gemmatirosa kalamazoonensis TaxID=861299 RepID=UPI00046D3E40|nr:alpha-amylase family glycosyl hydrolase [Gemmatirosa kalamazoonensis]